MADTGPSIKLKINDQVTAKADELVDRLKRARAELRALEKEAEKSIRATGKVGEDALKQLDSAKKRVGLINSQLRTVRTGGPSVSNLGDVKNLIEGGDAFKTFRGGIKGMIGKTRIGAGAARILGTPGFSSGLRMAGAAGAIALATTALARGALATYDRDIAGERMDEQIRLAEAFGQDTELMKMQRDAQGIGKNMFSRFGRGVGGTLPFVGGLINKGFDAIDGVTAYAKGLGEADLARAKFMDDTKDLTEKQRFKLYERSKQDADGNYIETALRDKIQQMLPEILSRFINGDREKRISEEAEKKLALAKTMEAAGYKLIEANNFGAANEAFASAAKHAGKDKSLDAVQAWLDGEAAIKARISYADSMNPVPKYRMGM